MFIAVSEFTARDMEIFLKVPIKEINVIHNGSSPHSFATFAESDSVLKKWELQKGAYLFTPGRTDYIGKGLDILLKSFREIRKYNPNLKLALAGPQGEGHNLLLEDLSKDQYADSNILYLGRVSDNELISLYANCLATIISSRFEGFGFPILEAMAYNVPVICSDAGSLPEVAGDAALIFKSENSKELSNTIKEILNFDNAQLEALKAKGQKRLQIFTWEKCAQQMYDVFLNAI